MINIYLYKVFEVFYQNLYTKREKENIKKISEIRLKERKDRDMQT